MLRWPMLALCVILALQLQAAAPTITALAPAPNSELSSRPASIVATFSQAIDSNSVNADSCRLVRAGTDGLFDTPDDAQITFSSFSVAGNTVVLGLQSVNLPPDKYRVTLLGSSAGRALHLDGTGQYVNRNLTQSLSITDRLTAEIWFNFESGGTQNPRLVNRTDLAWELFMNGTGGSRTLTAQITTVSNGQFILQSAGSFAAGGWHHAAITYDQTTFSLYIDGSLQAQKPATGELAVATHPLSIGRKAPLANDYYKGYIDECRVWNIARTQAEIQSSMTRRLQGSESGLVVYWPFDESSGQLVVDGSSNQNDGTLGADENAASDDPQRVLSTVPFGVAIMDTLGNALDGEPNANFPSGNGTAGGDFTAVFQIVNSAPAAASQTVSVHSGASKSITLAGSDANQDALTFQIKSQPAHGTLAGSAPDLTFTASATYAGSDSFTFTVSDGVTESAIATVAINITNDVPVAASQTVNVHPDVAKSITLSASDADGDLVTYQVLSQPQYGILTGIAPNLNYTPDDDYAGPDAFAFAASDAVGQGAPATITIDVSNAVPVAAAQTVNVHTATPIGIVLSATDGDGDELDFHLESSPAHGQLTGTEPNLTYTSVAGYAGPDSFMFSVSDGIASSAAVTVTINVTNTAPQADNQFLNTHSGTPLSVVLTGTDADSDPLTFQVTTLPAHGTLTGTPPNLVYTSSATFTGTDTIGYVANDGIAGSLPGTITIDVANESPSASGQFVTVHSGAVKAITLTGADSDGDPLSFQIVTLPAHGTLSGAPPDVSYTSNSGYVGVDTFTFTVSDGIASSPPASVTINVANTPPANSELPEMQGAFAVGATLTGTNGVWADPDGDPLSFSYLWERADDALGSAAAVIGAASSIQLSAAEAHKFVRLNVVANDGLGGTKKVSTAWTSVQNSAPVFNSAISATPAEVSVRDTIVFAASTADADGDVLQVQWDFKDGTTAIGGEVSHAFAVAGSYAVTATVSDGAGATQSSVTVTVNPAIDATVSKGSVKFVFNAAGKDSFALSGTIPLPAGLVIKDKPLDIYIVDFVSTGLAFDKTNTAKSGKTISFKLSAKIDKGTGGIIAPPPAKFALTIKGLTLFGALADAGFVNDDVKGIQVPVTGTFRIAGVPYNAQKTFSYTAKKGKSGTGK